jgi:hypothetical protein
MENFRQMIEGKKVLLLGPASYLYDGTYKDDLDDYDVVIKINRMVETGLCSDFKNDRCDILYHCLDISPQHGNVKYDLKKIHSQGVKHIRIPYPPVNGWYCKMLNIFETEIKELIPYSVCAPELYLALVDGCGNTSPNTGVIAIFDILRNHPELLQIKGITFFKGGYNRNYREKIVTEEEVEAQNSIVKNHNTNKQRLFVTSTLLKYDNVSFDEEFTNGLKIR